MFIIETKQNYQLLQKLLKINSAFLYQINYFTRKLTQTAKTDGCFDNSVLSRRLYG